MKRVLVGLAMACLLACGGGDDDGGSADAVPTVDADPLAPDAMLLPIYSPCAVNEECDTGLCFPFNMNGPHCTIECPMAPEECPAPSSGCNGMGVCKIN